jgi:hypothetical protein
MDEQINTAVAEIMAARYQPKVGDRVRVRVNPECEYARRDGPSLDGATGTVVEYVPDPLAPAEHYWRVRVDPPSLNHPRTGGWRCAPTELELLP